MFFTRRLCYSTIHNILSSSHPTQVSTPVALNAWIKSVRKQKKVAFAVVSDGSDGRGLQLVMPDPTLAKGLTNGTAIHVKGHLVPSPAKGQEKELVVTQLDILGHSDPHAYPIQKQSLSTEYLRDHVHLRARTDRVAAMLRLRSDIARTLGSFFENQGFINVHAPILTANDCEGAGEAFKIAPVPPHPDSPSLDSPLPAEFFSRPAYLTVSAQLHLEAMAWAMGRVYTLGPCFRAERSMTGRHLSEFWMLEAEWNISPSESNHLDTICDTLEQSTKHLLSQCIDPSSSGARMYHDVTSLWSDSTLDDTRYTLLQSASDPSKPWLRISYTEAITLLQSAHSNHPFQFPPIWGNALQSEHERYIAQVIAKGPVFVQDYPAALKPFYMRLNDETTTSEESKRTVACFDLLVPGIGELAGGSVREDRLTHLVNALPTPPPDDLDWYIDLRRNGSSPHGGFGMGFERLVSWISGIENIRECIPIPRWAGRLLL